MSRTRAPSSTADVVPTPDQTPDRTAIPDPIGTAIPDLIGTAIRDPTATAIPDLIAIAIRGPIAIPGQVADSEPTEHHLTA